MPQHNPLIIALDTDSSGEALKLVRRLKETGVAFKVGFELFSAHGPKIVEKILSHHVRVFLDLKFHDIPNTVAKAAQVCTKMGVWMFNVHTSGGIDMMVAARDAAREAAYKNKTKAPILLGVTVLTSMNNLSHLNIPLSVEDQVLHLASLAKQAELDGVVCSAQETKAIAQKCGKDFCLVTPGIRMPDDAAGDQKRIVTPRDAMQNGSHYLVVGRPVTQSGAPLTSVDRILASLK
ncbi:orotidine-5'-phosphate decarboxylase [bacterium]|nr:orotidine-5'-phosphate decarboxylase [bacterium]